MPSTSLSFEGRLVHLMIPLRTPNALLDRVECFSIPERSLIGIKEVAQNEPVLAGHFPDEPIFPASLLIDAMAQSCGLILILEHLLTRVEQPELLCDEGHLRSVLPAPSALLADSKIEQLGLVYPGDQVRLEAQLITRRADVAYFKARALVDGAEVAIGTIMLAVTRLRS